jgi:hypothetical protein
MDPGCTRGSKLLSDKTTHFLWEKSDLPDMFIVRARFQQVEIFVLTVASLLEAFYEQIQNQLEEDSHRSLEPEYYISLLIRYLFLEQEVQRSKLEENYNWVFAKNRLGVHVRADKRTGVMRGGKTWGSKMQCGLEQGAVHVNREKGSCCPKGLYFLKSHLQFYFPICAQRPSSAYSNCTCGNTLILCSQTRGRRSNK